MTAATPIEVTRRWLDACAACDLEAALATLSDDIVINAPFSPPDIPAPKVVSGKAAVREMLGAMLGAIGTFAFHDVELHTTDDPELVFGTGRSEAVMKSGQPYANRYVFVAYVRDGRIYNYYEYFDAHIASQGFAFAKKG